MKVLVMSDTHGRIDRAEKIIRNTDGVDTLIHLGDSFRDAEKLAEKFPHLKVEYVYGNCDYGVADVPAEKLIVINGKKIFITHGHSYYVNRGYNIIKAKAQQADADLILFGHTHIAKTMYEPGVMLLNPGSLSKSRNDKKESCALLEFTTAGIDARFIFV